MADIIQKDVIIVGGGISGLTAAIYAARAGRNTVLIDKEICGGLVNSTHTLENVPSHKTIGGMEFISLVQQQVEELGVQIEEVTEIEDFSLTGDNKVITTDMEKFEAPAVILSTGRKPIPLPIETDCPNIHYCSICDGTHYKGKRVLVVGGGNSAFDESLYMMEIGIKELTLIEKMPRFFAAQSTQDNLLNRDGVTGHKATEVKSLSYDKSGIDVVLEKDGEEFTIQFDGIFVYLGQEPNTVDFSDTIDCTKNGYVVTNDSLETNIPGVFVAGDVVDKKIRQVTTAMADGTIAALNADSFLRNLQSQA